MPTFTQEAIATKKKKDIKLVGVDMYIITDRGIPKFPDGEFGPFKCEFISNRGTKVWPGFVSPDLLMVNWYRCRFVATRDVQDAEINAFLSVASKAAALALLVRVVIGLGVAPPSHAQQLPHEAAIRAPAGTHFVALQDAPAAEDAVDFNGDRAAVLARLKPVRNYMAWLVALAAVITCTFGNLAAYGQTNIKRLLAYSTIAHAGYMMMAVPPMLALADRDVGRAQEAVAALALYIVVYLFMNLGAFAIVAFLRNALRSEEIADYAGLVRRAPWTVICFSVILFSLVGMPPLAGFLGKFAVFAAVADGYVVVARDGGAANYLLWLLVIGGVNTAISLFYYLRVVKVMTIDPEPHSRTPFSVGVFPVAYVVLLTFPLIVLIFTWNFLNEWTLQAAGQLL